jgi:hypothetical protein
MITGASLLVGMISVCAFSSVTMALTTLIDIQNKDLKFGKKNKEEEGETDVTKLIRKELKS